MPKIVKYGTWGWHPRKGQAVLMAGPGQHTVSFAVPPKMLYDLCPDDPIPLYPTGKTCTVEQRPADWFTQHRCEYHDVLVIWYDKGIPK